MGNVQVMSQPVQMPPGYPPTPPVSLRPQGLGRGALIGIMVGAVAIGALFAWLIFSGR